MKSILILMRIKEDIDCPILAMVGLCLYIMSFLEKTSLTESSDKKLELSSLIQFSL